MCCMRGYQGCLLSPSLSSQYGSSILIVYEHEVNGLVLNGYFCLCMRQFGHLQVLGWEGLWGTLGMAIIGMPLAWLLPGSDIGQ
jgi:hypothetical protein